MLKTCNKCGVEKTTLDFHKDVHKRDGLHTVCKACRCTHGGVIPDKECKTCGKLFKPDNIMSCARKYCSYMCSPHSTTRMDLTSQEWYDMYNKQEGKCTICGIKPDKLFVDHNHKTNQIRDMLCHCCNAAIGFLKEDIEIMERAIDYIKKWN